MSAKQQDYTTAQAAETLGLSLKEIQRLCLAGKFGRKIGRDWLISAREVEAYRKADRRRGWPKGKPRGRKAAKKKPGSK